MKKENLLFNIGNTLTEVRITHARRSLLYFIKDFINFELSPHQEMLIRRMEMKEAHKRNYEKRRNKMEQEQIYKTTHEFFIAGVQFHELKNVINDLFESDNLLLTPESNNKFDPNAVRIEWLGKNYVSTMLGFVPKKFSSEVAAALEVGKELECVLITLNKNAKPWEMAEVEIREML